MSAMYSIFMHAVTVLYGQLSFGENSYFFISCTMLDGGSHGFGMQLSKLRVLKNDFVPC